MSEKWYDPLSKKWYEIDLIKARDEKIAAQIEENNKLREENVRLKRELEKKRWEKITEPAKDGLLMFLFAFLHAGAFIGIILFLLWAF